MDLETFCKRFMLTCGLCFSKVIEENSFVEIAK